MLTYFLWYEMKKLTVVLTALLCCSLAYSQEVDVRIIPRADVNTYVPTASGEGWDVDFGNTSLYTLIEGTFLEDFSYSVANHWISMYGYQTPGSDIAGLYTGSLYNNANNWLDWANLTYTLSTEKAGSFSITAGKDVMVIGGYETDAYDWDAHFGLASMFWNYAPIYQWGGKLGYITPGESTEIYFQATTSPYGGMMFRDKQFVHLGLIGYGEYGFYRPIWSTNFVQYAPGKFMNIIALGNEVDAGPVTIGMDWLNRARTTTDFFNQEFTLMGTVKWAINDQFELFAKGGWESFREDGFFTNPLTEENDVYGLYTEYADVDLGVFKPLPQDYVWGGIGLHWYPLKDSQDLRVHAVVTANNWSNSIQVNIGAIYNFSVTDLFKK